MKFFEVYAYLLGQLKFDLFTTLSIFADLIAMLINKMVSAHGIYEE